MKILAIETSCDETGISVIDAHGDLSDAKFGVLADKIASQASLHAQYGGVFPNLAKNEHTKNLPLLLKQIQESVDISALDCLAITHGPGLAPALWTGVNFTKELSKKLSTSRPMPIVPVNHMEGHVLSALLKTDDKINYTLTPAVFPALALLVSGGHTQLLLMHDWFEYELLGETRDDAVGEAFDKVARMLGLPYPGGPHISRLAEQARNSNLEALNPSLPRPMLNSGDYDFSFSGLKTAVLKLVKDRTTRRVVLSEDEKKQIAKEFEDAATDVLVEKTARAIAEFGAKTLLVAGGVAANKHLQNRLKELMEQEYSDVSLHLPPPNLTGDNSLMIAVAGYFRAIQGEYTEPEDLEARANLTLY